MKKILIILFLNFINFDLIPKITYLNTPKEISEKYYCFFSVRHIDSFGFKDIPQMDVDQLNELKGKLRGCETVNGFPWSFFSFEDNNDLIDIFRNFKKDHDANKWDITYPCLCLFYDNSEKYSKEIKLKYRLYDFLDSLDYADKFFENCVIL